MATWAKTSGMDMDGSYWPVPCCHSASLGGAIGEYLFTDATGAQYHLNQNSGGIWTSQESIYVSYDANEGYLHFNDGSFWYMEECISGGTEWDAGTMYPTRMEDSNGNYILIGYYNGVGITGTNSSSRISGIEDVRGNGSQDYTFSYSSDPIPHLLTITNNIGTSENYNFAYTGNYTLNSPFNQQPFGTTVTLLQSSTVTGIPLTTYFTYDTTSPYTSCSGPGTGTSGAGQLTQVTTPYCGHLRWMYTTGNTLSGSRVYNEVANRYLSMSSGATETPISLTRGDGHLQHRPLLGDAQRHGCDSSGAAVQRRKNLDLPDRRTVQHRPATQL